VLQGGTADAVQRRNGAGIHRLVRVGEQLVHVAVRQVAPQRVIFGARATAEECAWEAIERMRFAVGVDDDLAEFHDRFSTDPVIGSAVRQMPGLRVKRRPDPWESLYAAITEQLIEYVRAVAIQRRMIATLGERCAETGLRIPPTPQQVADTSPALLESFDLAPKRAITLRRVAIEVAAGRICLTEHEPAWQRLLRMRNIGPWTVEILALFGQGRNDVIPAGDLGYIKLVGRLKDGNPQARAEVPEVYEFFERYAGWAGLAGEYLRVAAGNGLLPLKAPARRPAPRPAAAGSSAAGSRPLAA
jgi:3-methyladenine DNA glycosylase/8-oxoguanine DNA glycosylase